MKKSIKYAGIAAATLLAVAPVAAPALSTASTTTVQAAEGDVTTTVKFNNTSNNGKTFADATVTGQPGTTQSIPLPTGYVAVDGSTTITLETANAEKTINIKESTDTDASNVKTALENFGDQFSDMSVDTLTTNGTVSFGSNNFQLGSSNEYSQSEFLANNNLVKNASDLTATDKNVLDSHDAQFYIVASDNQGNTYDGSTTLNRQQLENAMSMDKYLPVNFTVYAKYKALGSQTYGSYQEVATFKVNPSNTNEIKSVNAKFTTPIDVAKNSDVAAAKLTNPAGVSIVDQNGDSVATQDIQLGNKFYYTYAAAMNNNGTTGVVNQNGNDIKDGEFKTAGTYYQRVTFIANPSSSLSYLISKYQNDPEGYTIYVNGKKATSGYDFTTNASSTQQTITFVRAINVSDSEAEWTTTENKGVVTTKSDTPYYTLVNDNGDKIANRALAKNSAWITDQKRVDQNGNTQYRVATGEWIDANNVTFSDKATTDEGAYTDEQALNGKVTLDGPSSFVYFLYNNNGEQIANRALTGDSAWFTDKKATNAAGVTVYHVATGEWVQAGSGVNYSAY